MHPPRPAARRVAAALAAAAALATSCDTADPPPSVAGAWDGTYLEAVAPARALGARLRLRQQGGQLAGTLVLVTGRSADASGVVTGRRVDLALSYLDDCRGTARWTLDLSPDGAALGGTAESFDCRGATRADVSLGRE
jgi:hypothetical protein